jgi:hypothetical protein
VLHRQVGGFLALENAVDVASCAAMLFDFIRPIGDQATIGDPTGSGIDGWQPMSGRERDDQIPTKERRGARRNNQAAAREPSDGTLDPLASRASTGVNSSPSCGATAWIAPNWPVPEVMEGSRMTAARVTPGANCFSSSSHFPLMLYSNSVNPVVLAPGRERLATYPAPTGSLTFTKTIGTVRVAFCTAAKAEPLLTKMTSGASEISSAAKLP